MRLPRNENGGIEGMPLQLMIVVIVAGLTLAVVLGWVLSIQAPAVIKGVSTDPTSVSYNVPANSAEARPVTIRVTAYDAKDTPIQGIIVQVSGATTGTRVVEDGSDGKADGTVTVSNLAVTLPPGVYVGELTLTIQKAGYPTKTWAVPVLRTG